MPITTLDEPDPLTRPKRQHQRTVYLSDEEAVELDRLAAATDRSISNTLRWLVKQGLMKATL